MLRLHTLFVNFTKDLYHFPSPNTTLKINELKYIKAICNHEQVLNSKMHFGSSISLLSKELVLLFWDIKATVVFFLVVINFHKQTKFLCLNVNYFQFYHLLAKNVNKHLWKIKDSFKLFLLFSCLQIHPLLCISKGYVFVLLHLIKSYKDLAKQEL